MKPSRPPLPGDTAVDVALRLVNQHLAKASLETLSIAIRKDESQVSRIRSEEIGVRISDVVRLLYAVGLKIVSAESVVVKRDTFDAVTTIARHAIADPELAKRLLLEEG